MQEVQLFVDKVNYCLIHLSPGDVKDPEYMFEWLYEKFKDWNQISRAIEKIKKSSPDNRRRTWDYLWSKIKEVLD